jgi:hypothetical protein
MEKPSICRQFGDDQLQGFGRAGRGRNHVDRRRAGAPQIFVREVEDHLIVGVGVDRGHGAADDLEIVVDHLGDRGQTIGGAGSVRNDVVLGGSYFSSFTPSTTVKSSFFAGAEMMTFFTSRADASWRRWRR